MHHTILMCSLLNTRKILVTDHGSHDPHLHYVSAPSLNPFLICSDIIDAPSRRAGRAVLVFEILISEHDLLLTGAIKGTLDVNN